MFARHTSGRVENGPPTIETIRIYGLLEAQPGAAFQANKHVIRYTIYETLAAQVPCHEILCFTEQQTFSMISRNHAYLGQLA